ncbi:MAG: thioredoxin domain-containing protein [Pirellulales bacterium]
MRAFVVGLLTLGLLTVIHMPTAGADEQAKASGKPQIVAVKFHADWCGSCRRMGSVFEDLAIVSEDEPVLFARLDLTDRRSRKQAAYLMTMLGLQEAWEGAGAGQKTGFILLIDPATKQPVGQLTADQDVKQMKAALLDVLSKNRG